jgi:hypothetical protein
MAHSDRHTRTEVTSTTSPSLPGGRSVPNMSHGDGVEPFQLLITDTGREGVKVHNNPLEGGLGILSLLNHQVPLALWVHNVHLLRAKRGLLKGLVKCNQ